MRSSGRRVQPAGRCDRVAAELNLAATLQDGAQVRVPSRDDDAAAGGGAGGGGGGGAGGGRGGGLIDLNTAIAGRARDAARDRPGDGRQDHRVPRDAPFATVDELRERGLVGEKTFEDIRALVTVG